jgi:hypothetical protein
MAWVQDNTTASGVSWVDDAALYNYNPMQSLSGNLQQFGDLGGLENAFIGPIQTAFATQAGRSDYGGQDAWKLIANNWDQLSKIVSSSRDPFNDVFRFANTTLQNAGLRPYSSADEWSAANKTIAGHNESLNAFNPIATAKEVGRVGSELIDEPGFQALALTAAGGQMLGGPAGAASGTAAAPTAMTSAPSAVAGGTGLNAAYAPTALGGTGASGLGVSAAYAPPALGGVGASSVGLDAGLAAAGWGAPATAGALAPAGSALSNPAPIASGGAAGVGGAATTGGGIAGILSNPMSLGIAGGALLGGLGGSEQAGTVTVEEGLPDWLMPYAKPQLDRYATDLANYQIDPYGVMPSAMQEFQKTISGQYLDPSTNKYLDDYFRLGAERIKGSLSPSFGHMQAFGQHSGYNEALSRGLGDFATGLYGGNYAKERDRQTQLTSAAPSFLGQASTSAFTPYQQYLGTIGSLGRKKDEPVFSNPFANILGGALTGGALANMYNFGK